MRQTTHMVGRRRPGGSHRGVTVLIGALGLLWLGCFSSAGQAASGAEVDIAPDPEIRALLERVVWLSWRNREEAARLIEEALEQAEQLPTKEDRTVSRMCVLALKRYVARDRKGRVRAYEEALKLARKLGGRRLEARMVKEVGLTGYRARRLEDAVEILDEAVRRLRRVGDGQGAGEALQWKGSALLSIGQFAGAREAYLRARELLVKSKSFSWVAMCDAALGFIGRVDHARVPVFMTSHNWACEMVQEVDGVLTYTGRTRAGGYASRGRERVFRTLLFDEAGYMGELVNASRQVGEVWEEDTRSFGRYPLRTVGTIVGDRERVTVPAGTFTNCRVIRMVTRETEQTLSERARTRRLNRRYCGVREVCYAPGVGIVRVRVVRKDGITTALVLKDYSIHGKTKDYLPLDVGNRWIYGWQGADGEDHAAEQVFEVRFNAANRVSYLSFYAYAHRMDAPPGFRADSRAVQAGYTPQDLPLGEPSYVVAHERFAQWTDHTRFIARSGEMVRVLVGENNAGVHAVQVTPTVRGERVDFRFEAIDKGQRVVAAWHLDDARPGKRVTTSARSVFRLEYMVKLQVKPTVTPVGEVDVEFSALVAIPPTREEARQWRAASRREG